MLGEQELEYAAQWEAWAGIHANEDRFEGLELFQLMFKSGELIELLAGPAAAKATMTTLYKALLASHPYQAVIENELARIDAIADEDWRLVWEDETGYPIGFTAGDLESIPVAQKFTALHAFAFGGVAPDRPQAPKEGDLDIVRDEIKELVQWGLELIEKIPDDWHSGEHMQETVSAANARLKLDQGENVSVEGLASLGRTGIKNLRNILARKDSTLVQEQGGITATSALDWLSKRPEYLPSVYERCDGSIFSESAQDAEIDDAVFVPVGKTDGQPFLPTLRRISGFTIGAKGQEFNIADYFEALEHLRRMPVPKWRRPNSEGNWGLVTGAEAWKRMSRSELNQMDSAGAGQADDV